MFGLHRLLRDISCSLAAKSSSVFTSCSLTAVRLLFAENVFMKPMSRSQNNKEIDKIMINKQLKDVKMILIIEGSFFFKKMISALKITHMVPDYSSSFTCPSCTLAGLILSLHTRPQLHQPSGAIWFSSLLETS